MRTCACLLPQAQTLELLLAGHDMVGRARTGCGKTLAFVLPIVEKLAESMGPNGRRTFGRQPSVIVLLPTRELAKQVRGLCASKLFVSVLRTLIHQRVIASLMCL